MSGKKTLSDLEIQRRYEAVRFILDHTEAVDLGGQDVGKEEAFPAGAKGRVAAINGLYRTNWFNGRFLTADALRADQVYADTRARFVAQIHPPGVAWGLTLKTLDAVHLPSTGGEIVRPENPGADPDDRGILEEACKAYHRDKEDTSIRSAVARTKVTWEAFVAWCDPKPQGDATGGLEIGTRVTLAPGLAFDDLGRPASVGAAFTFTFTDLINRYRTRPSVVVGGGTTFTPCACIEELPPGSVPTGASLPEGPYLLLIFPIEAGEGKAKVYGDACAASGSAEACAAEGWRGGFELRLARLKVEVPQESWTDAWDLRGMLSAWYFDLYEHDLRTRWNRAGATAPYFPADPAQWKGPGPAARVEAGVPLALVYIGSDGSVLFLDEWIPRRPIAATGSAAWAANARGAPTPAARVARVHQFQTMLLDSLAVAPQFGANTKGKSLYERGFRHIPPWGFLPVPEPPPLVAEEVGPLRLLLMSEARAIESAKTAAKAWFAGTNVVPIFHVAIHDDDLLEDIGRADEKDPISLRLREPGTLTAQLIECLGGRAANTSANVFLLVLGRMLAAVARHFGDLTIEQLVNREVEVVKIILPMEPKRRTFPIVGRVSEDPLTGLFAAWSKLQTTNSRVGQLYDLWFGDVLGTAAAPRRFVFYVKQRMVVLDWLYLVLDFLLDLLAVAEALFKDQIEACAERKGFQKIEIGSMTHEAPVTGEDTEAAEGVAEVVAAGPQTVRVESRSVPAMNMIANAFVPARSRDLTVPTVRFEEVKALAAPLRARVADTARAVLAIDGARQVATEVLRTTFPELGLSGTWAAYEREKKAGGGRDVALDALSNEHAGFGALKALSLVLPEAETDTLIASVASAAEGTTKANAAPLATTTFYADGYRTRAGAEGEILAELRASYGEKPAAEVVEGAPAHVKVDDLLAGTPDEAARTLGKANATKAVARIRTDAKSLTTAAHTLAGAPAVRTEAFWTAVDVARKDTPDLAAALARVEKEGTAATKTAAAALGKVAPALGEEGLTALAARLVPGRKP